MSDMQKPRATFLDAMRDDAMGTKEVTAKERRRIADELRHDSGEKDPAVQTFDGSLFVGRETEPKGES